MIIILMTGGATVNRPSAQGGVRLRRPFRLAEIFQRSSGAEQHALRHKTSSWAS
jgi:hypothetical protein